GSYSVPVSATARKNGLSTSQLFTWPRLTGGTPCRSHRGDQVRLGGCRRPERIKFAHRKVRNNRISTFSFPGLSMSLAPVQFRLRLFNARLRDPIGRELLNDTRAHSSCSRDVSISVDRITEFQFGHTTPVQGAGKPGIGFQSRIVV